MLSNIPSLRLPAGLLYHAELPLDQTADPSSDITTHPAAQACAPSSASEPKSSTTATHQDAPALLSAVVDRTFCSLIHQLFVKAIPLPESEAFFRVAKELHRVSANQTSARAKLQEVAYLLGTLRKPLNTTEAQNSAPLRTLSAYLNAVLPWIKEVDRQWLNFELALADISRPANWTVKSIGILDQIQRLVQLPAFRDITQQSEVRVCLDHVESVKQLLSKIQLLSKLPGTATLHDYLSTLTTTPLWIGGINQQLKPIVSALSLVCQNHPCPIGQDLGDQLRWLTMVLTDPRLQEELQPHLVMLLKNEDNARQFTAVLHVSNAISRFPTNLSPIAQAQWLMRTLADSGVVECLAVSAQGGTIQAWPGGQWAAAIVNDKRIMGLCNAMLNADTSMDGWTRLAHALACAALGGSNEWTAGQACEYLMGSALKTASSHAVRYVSTSALPLHACAEIDRFYRECTETESWCDMMSRLSKSMFRVVGPEVFERVMQAPAAASTVRFAEILQGHTDWTHTLQWFVAQDTSQNAVLTHLYDHYVTVLVAWKAYQTLGLDDIDESEAALRSLTYKLRDIEVVRRFPRLGKLIDLLPLLPTLRQIHVQTADKPCSSLWDQAALWQEALLKADTPAALAARERLTECATNWLVDAGMAAFDHLVSLPWSPTGCDAKATAPAAIVGNIAETSMYRPTAAQVPLAKITTTTPASNMPAHTLTSPTLPLAAGATLGIIGAASLMCGLWQCMKNRRDYRLVSPTPVSTSTGAIPLVAGATALTTAGLLIYPHLGTLFANESAFGASPANDEAAGASNSADPPEILRIRQLYPDIAHAVDSLELPNWGSFSGALLGSSNGLSRSAREVNHEAFFDTGIGTGSGYRGASSSERAQRTYIDLGIQGYLDEKSADLAAQAELELLVNRCRNDPYVLKATDDEERATRKLLKLVQSVLEMARDLDVITDLGKQSRLRELWAVLYGLFTTASNGVYAQQVHAAQAIFEISSALPFRDLVEINSVDLTLAPELLQAGTEMLIKAYNPVLDPSIYIDDYIRAILANHKFQTGREFTVDSMIEITLKPVYLGDLDHLSVQPAQKKREFSIRDIVLGQHHYIIDQMRNQGITYEIESTTESDLIARFSKDDLQSTMQTSLNRYRANSEAVDNLARCNKALMIQRCVWYLDKTSRFPMFATAVKKFLAGEANAHLLRFHGQPINGGFCISITPSVFLILSTDEPEYFYVFEKEFRFFSNGVRQSAMIPEFPDSFLDWIYSKIPIITATKYYDRESAKENRIVASRFGGGLPNLDRSDIFDAEAFRLSQKYILNDLNIVLTTAFLDRVDSDIDTLIFSKGERALLHLLDVVNAALAWVGLAAPLVLPGTGTLLTLVCSAIVNMGLAAASVILPTVQMHISDRAADQSGYAFEAFIGVLLCGVTARPEAMRLLNSLKMPINEASQAIAAYRSMRKAAARLFRAKGLTVPRPLMAQESFRSAQLAAGGSIGVPPAPANAARPHHAPDVAQLANAHSQFHYPSSKNFKPVGMVALPGSEIVGYRSIANSKYVLLSTGAAKGTIVPSRNLVISAVGNHLPSDAGPTAQSISLPPRATLEMLGPKNPNLFDSAVEVINKDPNLKIYARREGELTQVNTLPQTLAEWLFGPGYNLTNLANTHGPTNGRVSNRESQAPDDQGALWRAIGRNRVFAASNFFLRCDVLVLNDDVKDTWESTPTRASLGAVLALDKQGLLTNSVGNSYSKITFTYCRSNFDRPADQLSNDSEVDKLASIANQEAPIWVRVIYQTTLNRDSHGQLTLSNTITQAAFIYKQPGPGAGVSRAATDKPLNYFERVYGQGLKFPGRG